MTLDGWRGDTAYQPCLAHAARGYPKRYDPLSPPTSPTIAHAIAGAGGSDTLDDLTSEIAMFRDSAMSYALLSRALRKTQLHTRTLIESTLYTPTCVPLFERTFCLPLPLCMRMDEDKRHAINVTVPPA